MPSKSLKKLPFNEEEIQTMLDNLELYSPDEIIEINGLVDELNARNNQRACQENLIAFCKHMQDDYMVGSHHKLLADMLEDIESRKKTRICVNIAPRHGKSQLVSIMFIAWYLGRNPTHKVMLVSHTSDLAVDFGRKVRNMINTATYREIFPETKLASDSKSAGRWNTSHGGEFYATGVGSALAGRGAHLLVVDDPHSEQDVLNGNFEVFDKAYDWFAYGARTRLMPAGAVAIVQCMTGDTPVLMADGCNKPLADVRPGDMAASYKDGELVSRKVLNHQSNGKDCIYAINTTCGKIVRANARHPFLVQKPDGVTEWVRLKDLKVGDSLVSLKDATSLLRRRPSEVCVTDALREPPTAADSQTRHIGTSVITASGKVKLAQLKAVMKRPRSQGTAVAITTKIGGITDTVGAAPRGIATHTLSADTVSLWKTTIKCWSSRMASALFAGSRQLNATPVLTGTTNYALTTAITAEKSGHSCATTATSPLDTPRHEARPLLSLNTSNFTPTTITSIEFCGVEEVFDVQIEETENFIANGVVSHNTRWHLSDLTGRLTKDMAMNDKADQYEVVEFPAIIEFENKKTKKITHKPLWPEFFDLEALLRTKASMPLFQWNAQYQQNPTAEEAAIVKREWWQHWTSETPPSCEYIIMSLDAAAEKHNRADYTSLTTWGVFLNEHEDAYNIIALNSILERYEFPELKQLCLDQYKEWEPDSFIVEKKSAGVAIYQELRRMGIPVQEYTPHRGTGDKIARLNSVSDIIASGLVWVPDTRWGEEIVEQIAAFPFASHDDIVDSTVMALMRFRQGGFIRLPSDEPEETEYFKQRRGGYY